MRSLQVMHVIPQDEWKDYSDLQVLMSGAGYYIGTIHTDQEFHFNEPGSRDTDYFFTEDEAKFVLAQMEATPVQENLEDYCVQLDGVIWKTGFDRRGVGYRFTP